MIHILRERRTCGGKTYLLVALLLPLGDQHGVRIAVLEEPVVELLADGLLLVVELVYVPAPLVGDLEYGPLRLVFGHIVVGGVLGVLHLVAEDEQVVFDVAEALWRRLALGGMSYCWHILFISEFSFLRLRCRRDVGAIKLSRVWIEVRTAVERQGWTMERYRGALLSH